MKNGDISSEIRLMVYGGSVKRCLLTAENLEDHLREATKEEPQNLPERDFKSFLYCLFFNVNFSNQ